MKQLFILSIMVFFVSANAQTTTQEVLYSKSYISLLVMYNNTRDTTEAKTIAKVYIKKARMESDSSKMALRYVKMAAISKRRNALKYLDTSITLSKNSKHLDFPGLAYINKSHLLYKKEEYEKSLQNAIFGYQNAIKKTI